MIQRDVEVSQLTLENFDYFNDASDTVAYLQSVGRMQEANKLRELNALWIQQQAARRGTEGDGLRYSPP